MGEKGNVTSEELVSATAGVGAVVAGTGTQVTAVFQDAAEDIKDKVVDKASDAGIGAATRSGSNARGTDPSEPTPD